ncbi:hypothetical protein Q9Q99_12675 [Curtobacterium flaccumfaciens]|nr:hypothetical protein Q9Q99_12675 [Curtobacterium flaccumfaciens]
MSRLEHFDLAILPQLLSMREFARRLKQDNKPVATWLHTVGHHVGAESHHERSLMTIADFHPAVHLISGQPFTVLWPAGAPLKTHTPDVMVMGPSNAPMIVDVRTPEEAADQTWMRKVPAITEALRLLGLGYAIWTGMSRPFRRNLENLTEAFVPAISYDRWSLVALDLCDEAMPATELADRLDASGYQRLWSLTLIRRMLWRQALLTNMFSPCTAGTRCCGRTMPSNGWRQEIAPNVPVTVDGVSYIIDTVNEAWVNLRDATGRVTTLPIRRLAKLITRADAPPPLSDKLNSLEQRASPAQSAKVAERKAILRWFETGLRPEQADGDPPDPRHDPTRITGRVPRINAMALVLAKRRGTQVESAKKHIRTMLEKATTGEAGLYDPRMLTDDLGTLPQRIESSVRTFLTNAAYQATVTEQAMFEAYCGWARREPDEIVPTQRTFERALTIVYARYPHLRRNAKSRASTAEGPKVSLQRRQPERIGELWLIDATPSNVMIHDPYADVSKQREVRLDYTKIMETCSRYVVGRSIAEEVNGYAASLAIADAFHRMTDEHDAVVFEGRTYPRPFVGLPHAISRWPIPPRRLLMDNGREFLNKHGMLTLHRLGIDVEPARVKDGRGKGRMERHFGSQKTGYEQQQRNYIGSAVSEARPRLNEGPGPHLAGTR